MVKSVVTMQPPKIADVADIQRIGKKRRRMLERRKRRKQQKIIVCLATILTICAAMLSVKVIPYVSDLMALRQEQAYINAYGAQMSDINPDYVGLLQIDGTTINYPVVRGLDNEKYLYTSFGGEENVMGSIFMDYRCTGDNVPHIIIYGHDVADLDGDRLMFGGLRNFLDEQYLAEHSIIKFIENDRVSEYEIFSARITDIDDPAYYLDFNIQGSFQAFAERNGAPMDVAQIITLSSCIGADNDRRIIVQGVLNDKTGDTSN